MDLTLKVVGVIPKVSTLMLLRIMSKGQIRSAVSNRENVKLKKLNQDGYNLNVPTIQR